MRKMSVALFVAGAAIVGVLGAAACSEPRAQASAMDDAAKVARGQYLVTIGGCNDCHTPLKMGPKGPEPDMSRMLSGHPEQAIVAAAARPGPEWLMTVNMTGTAHAGPWGVSFSANLTPDENTGLGIWTEDMFTKALRTGRHMGASREILPPMPWPNYAKMTDEDLTAMYAYLRSIPPVHNRVPDPLPPTGMPNTTN